MVEKTLKNESASKFERNLNDSYLVKEKKLEQKERIPLQQDESQWKTVVKNKPKIVEEIREKPIIGEVHEKRQVQRKRKDVIKEKYEQPVIQVEEQPIIKKIERKPLYKKIREEEKVEEYGNKFSTAQQTGKLHEGADKVHVKLTKEQPTVDRVVEKPVVSEVSHRDNVKIVNQPVIHEIHEQPIIEEHEQPIIKRYYNQPIVKKVVNKPVFVTEGYEEAERQRRSDLKPTNKKMVDQVEQTMESNINQDYKGYDKLPYDYEETEEGKTSERSYAEVAKVGPALRKRKVSQPEEKAKQFRGEMFEKKEIIGIKKRSPLIEKPKSSSEEMAIKNSMKNEMDVNKELLELEKRRRRERELEEEEVIEEYGLFATFKRILKSTWNFFFGAFARF